MARSLVVPAGTVKGVNAMTSVLIADGIGDFGDFISANLNRCYDYATHDYSSGWAGKRLPAAVKALQLGDTKHVAKADAMLADIEARLDWQSHRFVTRNSVVGAVPDVAAYLAGTPMNMRLRRREADDMAPLVIAVDAVVSAGVSNEELVARGVAVLALVRVLAASRPVTLYVAGGIRAVGRDENTLTLVPVDTAPLNLAQACFALCDNTMARNLSFNAGKLVAQRGWNDHSLQFFGGTIEASRKGMGQTVRHVTGVSSDNFLFVTAGFLGEKFNVDWVLDMVAKYGRAEDNDEDNDEGND